MAKDDSSSLDKTQDRPLYLQLADKIRNEIDLKEWAVGSRIPSENEIVSLCQVSRGTVRKAIKQLVSEGLLVQKHGSGTYVADADITHPAGTRPLSFATSLAQQGKQFKTRVVGMRVVPASLDVADELGLNEGDKTMLLRRVRTVEGNPVLCQESWSNLVACPGLEDVDFTKVSMFDAVEQCSGGRIYRSDMRYTARVAGHDHAELLGCEDNAAVLVLEQNIRLEDGRSIEWSTTWLTPGQAIVSTAYQF